MASWDYLAAFQAPDHPVAAIGSRACWCPKMHAFWGVSCQSLHGHETKSGVFFVLAACSWSLYGPRQTAEAGLGWCMGRPEYVILKCSCTQKITSHHLIERNQIRGPGPGMRTGHSSHSLTLLLNTGRLGHRHDAEAMLLCKSLSG